MTERLVRQYFFAAPHRLYAVGKQVRHAIVIGALDTGSESWRIANFRRNTRVGVALDNFYPW